jgi:L-threonylcarbamoyladenylate synthase
MSAFHEKFDERRASYRLLPYDDCVTDVLRVDPTRPDRDAIGIAAARLRAGGLVAFPTETVYGLGAHALDRAAVQRLFTAKGRPVHDPVIVHVDSIDRVGPLVTDVPDAALALARRFWPGPLTLVMRRSAHVPDEVTAGLDTVAIRVPAHPVAAALLIAAAIPVAAPSANLFSRPSPTQASHVLEDLHGRIDLIIDGGVTMLGIESTVLDLSGETPTILRPGATTIEMLRDVVPTVVMRAGDQIEGNAAPSPGLLPKHYSPRAPLTLYEGDPTAALQRLVSDAVNAIERSQSVGIIAAEEDWYTVEGIGNPRLRLVEVRYLGSEHDLPAIASRLYAAMRDLDAAGVTQILVRSFSIDDGLGVAIHDRLRRAAAGRIVRA